MSADLLKMIKRDLVDARSPSTMSGLAALIPEGLGNQINRLAEVVGIADELLEP